MKNTILKSILAIGVIAFATLITAVSCGKTAGSNNNNNNSGNNNGGGVEKPCTTDTCLTLKPAATPLAWVKVSDDNVTISAAGWAAAGGPLSDANPANRGFDAAAVAGNSFDIFNIEYPGAISGTSVGLYFVNRAHVTKDTITLQATTNACPRNETDETLLAESAGGGTCRYYFNPSGNVVDFHNYLGTVFNNVKDTSHARGTMRCLTRLAKALPSGAGHEVVSDTTIFNRPPGTVCSIAMVNNGLGTGVEIDDAWVTDSGSTTEAEFYSIGINVTGKTASQFSDAPGYNLAEFIKAHDNAAFKRLLQNNKWADLKFKVKIVKSTDF